MGIMEKNAASVLAVKHPHKKITPCSMLEVYDKTPFFIPMDIA